MFSGILFALTLWYCSRKTGLFQNRTGLLRSWANDRLLLGVHEKRLGIWNIYAVPSTKSTSPTSGTTGVCVLRKAVEVGTAWMGGNHGNETLKTLEFLVDSKKIDYGTVEVKRNLTIVETTDLVYPEGSLVVGSVVRTYVIDLSEPGKMEFSQETSWHEDMLVDRAFMCMLPMMKKHGRHFQMGDFSDSFEDRVRTDGRKGFKCDRNVNVRRPQLGNHCRNQEPRNSRPLQAHIRRCLRLGSCSRSGEALLS